jgi:phage repressor protein C with HTH and peptisase S24 domain
MSIGERLRTVRKEKGLSRSGLGATSGVAVSTIQRWEGLTDDADKGFPNGAQLRKLREILKINLDWLLSGEGEPCIEKKEEARGGAFSVSSYCFVARAEGGASAGPGGVVFENIIDYFPFKRSFIERICGPRPEKRKNLYIIPVRGDSMYPTISSGELVMINCNEEARVALLDDHMYAVRTPEGDVSVKRLFWDRGDGGRLLIISDNKSLYTAYSIDLSNRDLREIMVGHVVWVGKELV